MSRQMEVAQKETMEGVEKLKEVVQETEIQKVETSARYSVCNSSQANINPASLASPSIIAAAGDQLPNTH